MSNLRQWGVGFMMYADSHKGAIPSDAPDGSSSGVINPLESTAWWFNAVPPYTGVKPYVDQLYLDAIGTQTLPHSGVNSIFVCPAANDPSSTQSEISPDKQYFLLNGQINDTTYAKPGPNGRGLNVGSTAKYKSFFCYAFNSKLFGTANDGNDYEAWKFAQLLPSSEVVLMTEKLVNPAEYKDPVVQRTGGSHITPQGYTSNIGQPKACWTRFTTRHRGGGFLLFADGHVGWWPWKDLQPSQSAANSHAQDANHLGMGVVWNPKSGVGTGTND